MHLEMRYKDHFFGNWIDISPGTKLEDINMTITSIRINKNRQYHRKDAPGLVEDYNMAMSWIILTKL